MDIQSHIQMPKLLLKRFHNLHNTFYYYDVEKHFIGSNGHARSTNTKYGYYSLDVEKYLSDNIEQPFSELLIFIEQIDFSQDSFCVPAGLEQVARNFVYSLISRDPALLSPIDENSIFFQFLSPQQRHDFAAVHGISIAQEKHLFDDYLFTFMVNQTNTPFVLPICGIFNYSLHGHSIINLPISPKTALCLVHKDYAHSLVHDTNIMSMFSINASNIIMKINGFAFSAQLRAGWGVVVSPEKSELDRLSSALCTHNP